jgi:hypothetical protein
LAVSAAYVTSDFYGQDNFALGAQYTMGESTNVGLLFFGGDAPDLITLYANHTLASGLTLAGYVADQDGYDTAFGLGASYPLGGGAAIKGAYHDRRCREHGRLRRDLQLLIRFSGLGWEERTFGSALFISGA